MERNIGLARPASAQATTVGNQAVDMRNGTSTATMKRVQKLNTKTQLRIKLTASADHSANNIPLICGAGVSRAALPAGITYEGDFASYALLQDYLINTRLHIAGVRIQSPDTDNYNERLIKGARRPNNKSPEEEEVNMDEYAKSVGDGFATTQKIMDFDFDVKPYNYLNLSTLKQGTSMTFYLIVDEMEQSADFSPLDF